MSSKTIVAHTAISMPPRTYLNRILQLDPEWDHLERERTRLS